MIGRSLFTMLGRDDVKVVRAKLAALSPANPVETHEQSHVGPDDQRSWQQWTNRAFFDVRRLRISWTRVCVASVSERKVRHGREEPTGRESPRPLGATRSRACLLYTSDAADDLLCVDL